ncbi:hypothetical protein LINPERHAP2_LOCUS39341, partial [Linum perenne]
MAHAMNYVFL